MRAFLEQSHQAAEQGKIRDFCETEKAGQQIGSGQSYRVVQMRCLRSLAKVVDRLCDSICILTLDIIRSITARSWIWACFY